MFKNYIVCVFDIIYDVYVLNHVLILFICKTLTVVLQNSFKTVYNFQIK